jgi:hypothetical protein
MQTIILIKLIISVHKIKPNADQQIDIIRNKQKKTNFLK